MGCVNVIINSFLGISFWSCKQYLTNVIKMQFNFLGKDSIKYENTVEVELPVYKAIIQFQSGGIHLFIFCSFAMLFKYKGK